MLVGLLLALCAGLCFAIGAGLFAHVLRRQLPFMGFLCIGGAVGLILSSITFVNWSALPTATRTSELCLWISLGAVANVAGHRAMAQAMAGGRAPVCWAIGQASQVVPFVASLVFWNERPGVVPWIGVAMILIGVTTLARTKADATHAASRGAIGFAILALAFYGANTTLMAVPSHWDNWHDAIRLRLPLTLGIFAIGGLCFWPNRDRATFRALAPLAIPYGVLLVVCFGCIYRSLDALGAVGAAGIFWPLACSTGVVVYAAWEHVVRRQRMRWLEIAGIATILLGIFGLAAERIG